MTVPHFRAEPLSRREIREQAHAFRHKLGLDNEKYIDVLFLVENVLPAIFPGFCVEVLPASQMGNCHGLTPINANKIQIREDVYEGAYFGRGRDRFTIMHEVWHYLTLYNHAVGFARCAPGEEIPTYCDPEWQANVFAGEFLMDSNIIRNMSVEQIAEECGVSYQAARIQKSKI